MNEHNQIDSAPEPLLPKGRLLQLKIGQIKPSSSNPRKLFDPAPLESLKNSIRAHGVLVPITVYKLPGQDRYAIVDGERRFRCCVLLEQEGMEITIPANVVEAPDKMAALIYMFNIHSFRESWELMPTALSLQNVIRDLEKKTGSAPTTVDLHQLTGLSISRIEDCKTIMSFDRRYQDLSLEPDPAKRIPSNFWIELAPVLRTARKHNLPLVEDLGEPGIIDRLVEKYRNKKIKSVIHFRRIQEAFEVTDDVESVADRFREYILDENLETRAAFDGFITEKRKVQKAVDACDKFLGTLEKSKVDLTIDEGREDLIRQLKGVIQYVSKLIESLQSVDPPFEAEEDFENGA